MPWQAAVLKIGARPFTAVVEEADVVISFFQRLDLARDEAIEFVEIGREVGRQVEVQGNLPEMSFVLDLRLGAMQRSCSDRFR